MDILEYQENALKTVAYPDDDVALDCTLAGLAGEMGEVFELWKKLRRGDYNVDGTLSIEKFQEFKEKTTKELGDLMWYIVVYAWLWSIDMNDVLTENIEKLSERQRNGTLHSSDREEE